MPGQKATIDNSFGAAFGRLVRKARDDQNVSLTELTIRVYNDAGRKSSISRLENGKIANPEAKTVFAIANALGIPQDEIDALRDPEPFDAYGMAKVIENLQAATQKQLAKLAVRFGIENAADLTEAKLREVLTEKARDYRALQDQVEAIDPSLQRLSNLKAAAQDAIRRVALEEVDELLGQVHATELEETAKTAELLADNALLRGNADRAYALLASAADSFAVIDPVEPVRRRNDAAVKLYEHGSRFGGTGLRRAIDMLSHPCIDAMRETDPKLWAATQNNLGAALRNQGARTDGAGDADLLAQAIDAYRAVMTVDTKAEHPLDWAMTQNNLGAALQQQGIRTAGAEGADMLAQAVDAYRAALNVYTRAEHPLNWAATQDNLGTALSNQGIRTAGPEGAVLLAQAVDAHHAALTVYTRAKHPLNWATTQNNLGITLQNRGIRTAGAEGADLLAQAVDAYHAALTVRTRAEQPLSWAMTMANIALAKLAIADHESTADPRPHLQAALAHVTEALEVFDPVHTSYHHANVTTLREAIATRLNALAP